MTRPVTTYILTFNTSVIDDGLRRANVNRLIKTAGRRYGLHCKGIQEILLKPTAKAPEPTKPERTPCEVIQRAIKNCNERTSHNGQTIKSKQGAG